MIVLVFILSRYWFKSIILDLFFHQYLVVRDPFRCGWPCDYEKYFLKNKKIQKINLNIPNIDVLLDFNKQNKIDANAYFRGLASHMMVEHQI